MSKAMIRVAIVKDAVVDRIESFSDVEARSVALGEREIAVPHTFAQAGWKMSSAGTIENPQDISGH